MTVMTVVTFIVIKYSKKIASSIYYSFFKGLTVYGLPGIAPRA